MNQNRGSGLVKRVWGLIYDELDVEVEEESEEAEKTIMEHLQDQTKYMTISAERREGG